jgi:hypothetical protein
MKRNPRLPRPVSTRDRRLASAILAVPIFQSSPEKNQDEPARAAPEHDAAEEAVRRMVEAAYM